MTLLDQAVVPAFTTALAALLAPLEQAAGISLDVQQVFGLLDGLRREVSVPLDKKRLDYFVFIQLIASRPICRPHASLSVGLVTEKPLGGDCLRKRRARHRVAMQALGNARRLEGLQLPSPLYRVDADTVRFKRIREHADNDIIIDDDPANIFECGMGGHAAHGFMMRIHSRRHPPDKFVNCECHRLPYTRRRARLVMTCQLAVQVRHRSAVHSHSRSLTSGPFKKTGSAALSWPNRHQIAVPRRHHPFG
jgi:hypothetical protein